MKKHILTIAAACAAAIVPFVSRADTFVSGPITTNTTWGGDTYFVTSDVTVNSGVTLTVQPGTVVKFVSGPVGLIVSNGGVLVAEGTASSNITFTASSTSPSAGYWDTIKIQTGASSTISYASVQYGGYNSCCGRVGADIYVNGGTLTLDTVDVATSTYYGVYQSSGSSNILNSSIHGQPSYYGVEVDAGTMNIASSNIYGNNTGFYSTGQLTLNGNTFSNSNYPGQVYFTTNTTFDPSSNTSTGSETHGYYVNGYAYASQTLPGGDLPYIVANLTVPNGSTLTLGQGAVVKFYTHSNITVANGGVLSVQGTAGSPVYFTSIYDQSIGGNTANSATPPAAGDWDTIKLASGASSTIANAKMYWGGYASSYNVGQGSMVYNTGGTLTLDTVEASSSVQYALYQTSGSANVLNSNVHASSSAYGFEIDGGTATINGANIHGNSIGLEINGGNASVTSSTIYSNGSGAQVYSGSFSVTSTEIATSTSYGIYQGGGTLDLAASNIHNSAFGLYVTSGTANVSSSKLHDQNRGVYMSGGTVTVKSTELFGNSYGLRYTGGGLTFQENAIYNNTSYGVDNESVSNISAINNYWGCFAGPGSTSPPCDSGTSGDQIYGNVSYDPWHHVNNHWAAKNFALNWNNTSSYSDQIAEATDDWNSSATGMGLVTIASSSSPLANVLISDYTDSSNSTTSGKRVCGLTTPSSTAPYTIKFNTYCMDHQIANELGVDAVPEVQLASVRHEFGHTLGLGHSDPDSSEIMYSDWKYFLTYFGLGDESDYKFIWSTMTWDTSSY